MVDAVREVEDREANSDDERVRGLEDLFEDTCIQSLLWEGVDFFSTGHKKATLSDMIEILEKTKINAEKEKMNNLTQLVYVIRFYKNIQKSIQKS
jgi:hypothetical protein